MRRSIGLLAAILPLGVLAVLRSAPQQSADDVAIRKVVQVYFDGMGKDDWAKTAPAFHPVTHLYWVDHDTLAGLNMDQWRRADFSPTPPANPGPMPLMRVLLVDITGNVAVAKVQEDYPKNVYTDYLSLLKIKGEWIVVGKIYVATPTGR